MEESRKNAPCYRKLYQQRISQIEEQNIKQQEERVKKNQESEKRLLETKEKITSEIINYGLWQSRIPTSVLSNPRHKNVWQ